MIINKKIQERYNAWINKRKCQYDSRRSEVAALSKTVTDMASSVKNILDTEKACRETGILLNLQKLEDIKKDSSIFIVRPHHDKNTVWVKFRVKTHTITLFELILNLEDEHIYIACWDDSHKEYSVDIAPRNHYLTEEEIDTLYNEVCDDARMIDTLEAFGKSLRVFVDETTKYYENLEI